MQTRAIISNSLGKTEAKEGSAKNYWSAVGSFFGFEFVYVSFLMVHFFKYTAIFESIQREIDLTAALFGLLILGWGANALRRAYRKNTFSSLLLPPLVLVGWTFFTLLYSEHWISGFGKILTFLPTTMAAFLVGYFVIAPSDRRLGNVFLWLIIFASFLAYINLESYYFHKGVAKYWLSADMVHRKFSSYIDRSLVIVSAATVVICFLFDRSFFGRIYAKFLRIRYFCSVLLLLFFLAVLHGGSRQGFAIFVAMPLLVYILYYISKRSYQRLYFSLMLLFISLSIVLIFYHFAEDIFETSIYRRLLEDPDYYGFSTARARIWLFSWLLIKEVPLKGIGFGGFTEASGQEYGSFKYPHNLFLEAWLELGLIGLLLLLVWTALFCKGATTVLLKKRDSLFIPILTVALVWFLSLQVSGSWIESRFAAAFIGILAGRIAINSSRNQSANSRSRDLEAVKERRRLRATEERLNGKKYEKILEHKRQQLSQ